MANTYFLQFYKNALKREVVRMKKGILVFLIELTEQK